MRGIMRDIVIGVVLVGLGCLYLTNPGILRRGIWMKTSIAVRSLSEEGYRKYIRALGMVIIAIGVGFVMWGLTAYLGLHG
jgi:hypothetical protein